MFRFLLADETFRSLNIPISPAAIKELDRKIRKGEPVDPVYTWNGFVLTGYEQDDLCLKYHKSVPTKEMFFPRRHDAIAWLCRKQLERTDLIWTAKAWLISRLYEALREVAGRQTAKEYFLYRQLSPSPRVSEYPETKKENTALLKQLGDEFHYHKETIRRYVQFGRHLDRLEELIPETRIRVLTGTLAVQMRHMPALIKTPVEQLEKQVRDKHTTRLLPSPEYFTRSPERKRVRQRSAVKVETGIKNMPEYDPDSELNGLRYTIGAWKKAIVRTAMQADLAHATDQGKESLKQALRELVIEAECLSRMLEEKHDD